ncbi:MAG: aldo/keto reductase [Myxococcota bacterium]|nr:aldo/keto reductase [Myxococcota bacterium]
MKLRPAVALGLCILVAGLVGYFVTGLYMEQTFIGLDPSAFPLGGFFQAVGSALLPSLDVTIAGLVLVIVSLLALAIAAFFFMRSASPARRDDEGRRSFLTGSMAGVIGAVGAGVAGGAAMAGRAFFGMGSEGGGWAQPAAEIFGAQVTKTHPEWKNEWRGSRVQEYRRFGRTEYQISDIVMGTGPLKGEEGEKVVNLALDRGINYIDTSPDYSASGSEQVVGRVLKTRREEAFLATKFCTPTGHLPADAPVSEYKRVFEESLGRLQTDHVDLIHVHSCDEVDRLMSENMHEAYDRLKQEGKVRFLGFSSHTPHLVQVANRAIESGRFDVMMLAYHHGIWPKLSEVIKRARDEQDMGIVAMKTLKGARHRGLEDFTPYADSYAQAALKWVRANDDVSCAVISMFELQQIDEYLYASGQKLRDQDIALLREYDRQVQGTYCSPHCGACLDSCPEGVPIADVLRQRMYFEDYGAEKIGMQLYADLDVDASACSSCDAPCLGSCPHGISIQERTTGAHELLRFA